MTRTSQNNVKNKNVMAIYWSSGIKMRGFKLLVKLCFEIGKNWQKKKHSWGCSWLLCSAGIFQYDFRVIQNVLFCLFFL